MEQLFLSISANGLTVTTYLISTGVSLVLGALIAFSGSIKQRMSQTMLITLVLLPAIVQTVIMLVNGNIGTGIAVAGAFSLVRFRSAQGNAKDIAMIFLAMAVGIATGTGFLMIGGVLTVVICLVYIAMNLLGIGARKEDEKVLKITIPESLDYSEVFDDLLSQYTREYRLIEVKTVNMGSMYRLQYQIALKKDATEKQLIDQLRTRNGNLEISISRAILEETL